MQHLEIVFQRLREARLKVHPGKCVFGASSMDFLGHRISANSLEPQQDKLAAVRVELKEQLYGAVVLHLPNVYQPFIMTTD